jgi:predicted ATPase
MIRKASIRNFKCLRDIRIDLERFTVFVGPNASGKSSILQALHFLCRAFGINQRKDLGSEILQGASRGASENVELAAESGGYWYRYRPPLPTSQPARAIRSAQWSGNEQGVAPDLNSHEWKPWKREPSQSVPLPQSVLLRLETSNLILPTAANSDPTVMAPDGTGLHTALASMALNDPDSWQRLQADLRRIIPTIRRLRHTKATMHQPSALLFDTVGADSLIASQVSEGTLLVLGLLAALHAADRPNLILLDDLDRGLHPKAQKELISLLRGLLETNADLQLIATTHSPYMLDSMIPSEVRMTFLQEDGATACAALASHPKFQKWKDEMTPGEMWSLFGEKWLVEEGATA